MRSRRRVTSEGGPSRKNAARWRSSVSFKALSVAEAGSILVMAFIWGILSGS
jgi:hypothetical protein